MISGIQHFAFCRRQWALIHLEQQWTENYKTMDGNFMHRQAHNGAFHEKRKDIIISRGMPVFSRIMGVGGICDIVEFHKCEDGVKLFGHRDLYSIYPVEYKKGKPKKSDEDILQLTAQTMCLEEMFSTRIEEGAIFYGETRRREQVYFSSELREEVENMFSEMHEYYKKNYTPKVKKTKACQSCSLKNLCLPKLEKTVSVKKYMSQIFEGDRK